MAVRTSHLPGFGVVVENSTTRTSHLPGFGVVAETAAEAAAGGRIMSSLASHGGLAGMGGIAGQGGGLAG